MLKIKNLDVFYGSVQALWDVNMYVKKGEALAILGANGAGKTTLLRAVSGLNKVAKGDIVFDGNSIIDQPAYLISQNGISHVPEGRSLFPNMTVGENLTLGGNLLSREKRDQNLESILTMFPKLKERFKQSAGSLSGGEQQMVALGRAIMSDPKVLLLDEPSTGLAPIMLPIIFNAIDVIRERGMTVVIVEQHVKEAFKHVERAYVIENGRIKLEGTPKELQENDEVRKAYLGIA